MTVDFKKYIASVQDFPNKGIVFRDITPILSDGEIFRAATHELAEYAKKRGADVIVTRSTWVYCGLSSCY